MTDSKNSMKRLPAVEKQISTIDSKSDVRVRILGTVIGNDNNSIMIDDGSGKAEVLFESPIEYIKEGQFIRIITRILPTISGFRCQGECIQVLEDFDIKLYKDSRNIISR
ncbi:MAG: hypothetical protein KJ697_01225 [Nanoarchaeota archaeon]|nr:hypothetical protein [Nanoarchaeota archaeon]MBU4123867.1 hypothetical protein [Nanoarchaeota archaeon]